MSVNRLIVLALVFTAGAFVSNGSAQQVADPGDLGLAARQEDSDSYWLDSSTWLFYGYRPHLAKVSRFAPSLPTWNAGQNGYSFGMNAPPNNAPWQGGRSKDQVQLTKYGTWH
jgi:hypothetical protein